jgi:F-box and WD-40 domain protein CDC4
MADENYFNPHEGHRDQQVDSDTDMAASASSTVRASFSNPARKERRAPRPIIVEDRGLDNFLSHDLSTAPASPPTPAPSPTPTQRALDWSTAAEHEDSHIKDIRALFGDMNGPERLRLLGELLNQCGSHELSFVAEFVSPRLKKDPFMVLPTELSLRVSW